MIEPVTIDGRTGTAVYLDERWMPVAADQAVIAKVVFDDGRIEFFNIRSNPPEETQ